MQSQLLKTTKELRAIMREDPMISPELPAVKRLVRRAVIWMLASECFLVMQVYPVKWFFDELSSPKPNRLYLYLTCAFMVVLYKTGALIRKKMSIWRNSAQWRMWRVWWGYGHRRELRLSADWHVAHGTGEKESLVAKNIIKFEAMIDQLVFDTLPATLRITFTTVMMFTVGLYYGLISLGTMLAYYAVMLLSERAIDPLRKDFRTRIKQIEQFGTEITANWRTIKEMGMEENFADQNDELLLNFWADEVPRHKLYMKYFMRQDNIVTYSRAALYVMIVLLAVNGRVALGSLVLATTLMERSYSNYARYSEFQARLNEGLESLRELVNLMCLPATVQQPLSPQWPARLTGHIQCSDVTFRYPDADDCSLKGVSFEAQPYTATALVGLSGCGKSTLVSLLQRMYDPTSGSVHVDGVDLRAMDFQRYRREAISIVSQDIQLFDRSIMDNIRMSAPDASDDQVYEAARLAFADDFIRAMPKGYDTIVGEDGVRLSGGQKQRVAIARALLRRPAILILDEATSALDELSQAEITKSIKSLIDQRRVTIIIIAHRFSTIMSADQVVVLKDGLVAEVGSHQELHRKNGLYRELRDRGDSLFE